MSDDTQFFDSFSRLPADLVPTSLQVMKFSGAYVIIEGDNTRFDWPGFQQAVNEYKGDDLSFDKFNNTTIPRSDASVSEMTDQIVAFLRNALSVDIDPKQLAATIEATFTNLQTQSSEGFLSFTQNTSSHNSSWEYRIAFAFPNPDLPQYFYSLVTTMKLEADIYEESQWWGLTNTTRKNFSAVIYAMELVVKRGFVDPSSA